MDLKDVLALLLKLGTFILALLTFVVILIQAMK